MNDVCSMVIMTEYERRVFSDDDNNNNEYLERLTRTGPKRLHVLYKYILSKFNAYNMNAHTHARTHTDSHTHARVHTHTHDDEYERRVFTDDNEYER